MKQSFFGFNVNDQTIVMNNYVLIQFNPETNNEDKTQ